MKEKNTGRAGEDAAAEFLLKKGYRIAERNYDCTIAEIDIVAYDGDMLCFVEVKTRKNSDFGFPCEYVDQRKQHKLRQGALCYMKQNATDCEIRFDVIEVYAHETVFGVKITGINHIENAF